MKYFVLQSLVGTNPVTGEEISLKPGDHVDWCPTEGPRLVEAGIFAPMPASVRQEVPEATKSRSRNKETR